MVLYVQLAVTKERVLSARDVGDKREKEAHRRDASKQVCAHRDLGSRRELAVSDQRKCSATTRAGRRANAARPE